MPGVIQVTLDLEDGISVSFDPDPSGVLVRLAKEQGLTGPELDPLAEKSLSGALRLTLTEERAEALAAELFNNLKS